LALGEHGDLRRFLFLPSGCIHLCLFPKHEPCGEGVARQRQSTRQLRHGVAGCWRHAWLAGRLQGGARRRVGPVETWLPDPWPEALNPREMGRVRRHIAQGHAQAPGTCRPQGALWIARLVAYARARPGRRRPRQPPPPRAHRLGGPVRPVLPRHARWRGGQAARPCKRWRPRGAWPHTRVQPQPKARQGADTTGAASLKPPARCPAWAAARRGARGSAWTASGPSGAAGAGIWPSWRGCRPHFLTNRRVGVGPRGLPVRAALWAAAAATVAGGGACRGSSRVVRWCTRALAGR
jgi:hypothetical protein